VRAISASVTKGITVGTLLTCADNTGARVLRVIGVVGYKGVKRRYPKAGVADIVVASVKKGAPDMKKKVVRAVVIRQRMPYRRANGRRVAFEDNAAVVINEKGEPKGSEVKGPVAKEVGERFSKIVRIASIVV